MKQFVRIPILFSLVGIVVVGLADNARAYIFDDDATTVGLWHMDATENETEPGQEDWLYVPDDNSTGRDAQQMDLGLRPIWGEPGEDVPTLTEGAPGMGNALLFDGVDDHARTLDQWPIPVDPDMLWPVDADTASIDFMFRPDGLPPSPGTDNHMGLVGVLPFQIYLQDDGSGEATGRVIAKAFDDNLLDNATAISQGGLALEEWHEVHAEVTNTGGESGYGVVSLTVDGVTNTADLEYGPLGTYYPSSAVIGNMVIYRMRHFSGALDEIRIATEPYVYPVLDAADFDEDDDVDGIDFLAWQRGTPLPGFAEKSEGDANGDGYVDEIDLGIWQDEFGYVATAVAAASAVPEPAGAMLMLLGLGGFAAARRRGNHGR